VEAREVPTTPQAALTFFARHWSAEDDGVRPGDDGRTRRGARVDHLAVRYMSFFFSRWRPANQGGYCRLERYGAPACTCLHPPTFGSCTSARSFRTTKHSPIRYSLLPSISSARPIHLHSCILTEFNIPTHAAPAERTPSPSTVVHLSVRPAHAPPPDTDALKKKKSRRRTAGGAGGGAARVTAGSGPGAADDAQVRASFIEQGFCVNLLFSL
jgi:hypothetical protein